MADDAPDWIPIELAAARVARRLGYSESAAMALLKLKYDNEVIRGKYSRDFPVPKILEGKTVRPYFKNSELAAQDVEACIKQELAANAPPKGKRGTKPKYPWEEILPQVREFLSKQEKRPQIKVVGIEIQEVAARLGFQGMDVSTALKEARALIKEVDWANRPNRPN